MATSAEILARLSDIRVSGGNEADTRYQVIDEILRSALEWESADYNFEERIAEDDKEYYLDYTITTAQTSFLVEAKRAQIDFSSLPTQRRAVLKGSWLKGDVKKAVIQARDYGRKRGVGFCVVTNGDAWIIFPINRRDLVSFEDTFAVIFRDANSALIADLTEFTELLSRKSVIDGSLETNLLGGDDNQTENRRFNKLYDKTFSKTTRTTMFSSIEDEIVTAFSEELIAENPDLLEKAYVDTADRMKFDDRIKMAVLRRDQVVRSRPIRPVGRGGVDAAADKFTSVRVKSQPIALLTLGLVGAGKTTFLRYVETISGRKYFDQLTSAPKAHWVKTDFRDFSKSISPRAHIYESILRYINKNDTLGDYIKSIEPAYKEEIANLTRGPLAVLKSNPQLLNERISALVVREYEDGPPYCKRLMLHAAKSQPTFLVIDNVDQIEESSIQEAIFLDALAIARECGFNLVLAMRDATYVKNRTSAVFDAFTFDAIYIDPPHIQSVLSKRFAIAEQLSKDKSFEVITDGGARVIVSDASRVVAMLSASVLGTQVGQLIEVAATGDIRLALRMTRQFLQFGYTTSYKSFQAFQRRGSYAFPVHEAIRAIMLGNQSIYRDEFSPLINPFDAKTGRSESQFLRIIIMNALVSAATTKEFEGIEAGEIIKTLEKLGFSSRVTGKVLKDLIDSRVCFSRSHQDFTTESVLAPSRLCGYIVRDLVGRLIFLETAVFDTFISDEAIWTDLKEKMKDIYSESRPVKRIKLRKALAKIFFDWCETEIQKVCNEAARRNLSPFWTTNPLSRMRAEFEQELDRALRSAVRNYGTVRERQSLGLPSEAT